MSAQRKRYLQLSAAASDPRDRLFYKLMAEFAPAVSDMARKNVNQHGATVVYDVILRISSALLLETAYNLSTVGAVDLDMLTRDFRTTLEQATEGMSIIGGAVCAPKMDS